MPVRHYRAHTVAAVNSVLRQTHSSIELLIIGHDDVDALLARLPQDVRIRGVARKAPGIVGALNTGLSASTGEYIARMDDDDVSRPERLSTQLDYLLKQPSVALCGARVRFFSDDTPIGDGNRRYEDWLNGLDEPTVLNAQCFVESPIRDKPWPEDYDLILRAWLQGIPMGKPDGVLLDWREHTERLTHRDPRYRREAFIQAKAWTLAQPQAGLKLDAGRPVWLCGTGRNARYWFDALSKHNIHVLGFVDLDREGAKQRKRHRPVINYTSLWAQRDNALLITAVTNPCARQQLQRWFNEQALQPGVDFIIGG